MERFRTVAGDDFIIFNGSDEQYLGGRLMGANAGIGGTYGFKVENYGISQKIGTSLFRQIEDAHADSVVCDCETCKMQIEMSTQARVMHPISILAEAIDVEETRRLNGLE